MKRLISAELLRLRTTRAIYGWAVACAAGVVLAVAVPIQTAGNNGQPGLDTNEGIHSVLAAAASNTVTLLFLGILALAAEFRHNTATATFLITPDRGRVVRAKLASSGLVGVAVATCSSALTLGIALPWMAARGVHVSMLSADVGRAVAGAAIATALYGTIGVGVAALIRSQVMAVALSFAWVMVVESLVVALAPNVGRWLPGGATNAITGASLSKGNVLPMWAGVLLLAAYGAAFAVAGTRLVLRRDVT